VRSGFFRGLAALLIALACSAAWSAGWVAVLKNSPAEDFDDEDIQLFLANAKTALDAPGTQPVAWVNPRTGSGGTFEVIGQPKAQSGAECKRVRMTLRSKKQQGNPSTLTACKDADGRWRLAKAG
jgi:surface antigen